MSNIVHRWQPTGWTPCGREVADVKTNVGYYLSDGVTCKVCNRANSFCSILFDDWNGQSDGLPRAGAASRADGA
jgi:hypothetical protein